MQGIRLHENLDNILNIQLNINTNQQLYVIGDLHGQFEDFIQILHIIDSQSDDSIPKQLLFLGDIVDRGLQSLETLLTILVMQQLWPDRVFLIRGNHETESISRLYGFYDECCRKNLQACYSMFLQFFQTLPIAVIITQNQENKQESQQAEDRQLSEFPKYFYEKLYLENQVHEDDQHQVKQTVQTEYTDQSQNRKQTSFTQSSFQQVNFNFKSLKDEKFDEEETQKQKIRRIFCSHGGISKNIQTLEELNFQIRAFNDFSEEKEQKVISDVLWSDPSNQCEFYDKSQRNKGCVFGYKATNEFLQTNDIQLIIRAHQWCTTGFKLELNDRVITVWSAANYEQRCGNTGALLKLENGCVFVSHFKKVFLDGDKRPSIQVDYFL